MYNIDYEKEERKKEMEKDDKNTKEVVELSNLFEYEKPSIKAIDLSCSQRPDWSCNPCSIFT